MKIVKETSEIEVRGEKIEADGEYAVCSRCGEKVWFPGLLDDLDEAYDKYREMKGMVRPEELAVVVEKLGVKKVARRIKCSIQDTERFCNGALHSEKQDARMKGFLKKIRTSDEEH